MALSNICAPSAEGYVMLGVSTTHVGALDNIVKQVEPEGNTTLQMLGVDVTHVGPLDNIVNSFDDGQSRHILRLVLTGGGGVTDVGYIG